MMGWIRNLPNSTTFWLALVAIVLIGSILGLYYEVWDWLRDTSDEAQASITTESRSTTIRNAGFVIAGALALIFAVWRSVVAQRQAETSQRQSETAQGQSETAQQGLLNDRYQKGAEMLGSEVLTVRLGGIYALQRLAEEHPEQYHIQIMELFCAFVRNPAGESENRVLWHYDGHGLAPSLREDVQAVMSAIGSRSEAGIDIEKATKSFKLNLRKAALQGIQLTEANLSGALLAGADLSVAMLENAEMQDITFTGANLSRAFFHSANLSGASFASANLSGASLRRADLSLADFWYADLSHASLADANLSGTDLKDANLTGASFNRVWGAGEFQFPAKYLTQAQLDEARSDPINPPDLAGVCDANTGKQLVWQDGSIYDQDEES